MIARNIAITSSNSWIGAMGILLRCGAYRAGAISGQGRLKRKANPNCGITDLAPTRGQTRSIVSGVDLAAVSPLVTPLTNPAAVAMRRFGGGLESPTCWRSKAGLSAMSISQT
jgi:hypothetical protein